MFKAGHVCVLTWLHQDFLFLIGAMLLMLLSLLSRRWLIRFEGSVELPQICTFVKVPTNKMQVALFKSILAKIVKSQISGGA